MKRRQVLTAGSLLAVGGLSGGLSGCLSRVASATTNTGAAPAAPFGGSGAYTGPSPAGDPTVYRLTPTIASGSGLLSGEVELEAWVTAQAVAATYDDGRGTRTTVRGPGDVDSDGDGVDDTVEVRATALDLENQLLTQTKAAADSISKRSARTGRNHLADMGDTIREVQAALERCGDDVCVTVREHADGRLGLTQQAATHVRNGEWDSADETLTEVREIVEGDIELLESSLNDANTSDGNGEIILGEDRDMVMPGDNVGALYDYLAGEPILSEQFTITVPDARLPGRDLALVDELTPRRLIEYVTGRADEDGTVYAWGEGSTAKTSENGRSNPLYEGEGLSGVNPLFQGLMDGGGDDGDARTLLESPALRSYVTGPVDTGVHLETFVSDGTVVVRPVNDRPVASDRSTVVAVSADATTAEPADFDDWGAESGAHATTATLVCPLVVLPPACPLPVPALLYVRRCRHDDQYIYSGGWVVDDGFLYESSMTLLVADGPGSVASARPRDFDGDGYGDVVSRQLSGERDRMGARLFDGEVSTALDEGVLPKAVEGDDIMLRKKPGRANVTDPDDDGDGVMDGDDVDDGDASTDRPVCVSVRLSAPIVHLTDAENASESVKFKAGAELSKSVN